MRDNESNPAGISRRRLLNDAIALTLVTPLVQLRPSPAQTARFGVVDRRMLRAAADVIIPADRKMPAASAVGVVNYIERIASQDDVVARALREGFRAVGSHATATHGSRFDLLPIAGQTAVLSEIEKANKPAGFFPMLRDLVYEAYYTQPRVQKLVGYTFRSGRRRTALPEPFDELLVARVRKQKAFYRSLS